MKNTNREPSNTRERILDTTSQIMSIKGVKETSLADIAKEVGISKGTLYYYYPTKDDIIYDIADLHLKKLTEELLTLIDTHKALSSPEVILIKVFEKIINAETRGKLHLYLLGDAIMGDALLKERFLEKYHEWHRTLEEGLRLIFDASDASYDLNAQLILAMLDGFLIQKLIGIINIPIEDVSKMLSQAIIKK